ncbi:hypothetical protein [Dyadobacter arcticus]|uniref:Uncharacterized protein n=1 Tax=Dyadobacter arcticus TaxID=1078754 RepID=A0ABX0UGU2_9BACT|nr:hypothetical protein [Dyadobacter arcticus]NIJ52233.1 hypothetical protein [Dyadobacter arcticus]
MTDFYRQRDAQMLTVLAPLTSRKRWPTRCLPTSTMARKTTGSSAASAALISVPEPTARCTPRTIFPVPINLSVYF